MKKYVNNSTGCELKEQEYKDLLIREYTEQWNQDLNLIAEEFKEDGKTLEDYINYQLQNDNDSDFELIEE